MQYCMIVAEVPEGTEIGHVDLTDPDGNLVESTPLAIEMSPRISEFSHPLQIPPKDTAAAAAWEE